MLNSHLVSMTINGPAPMLLAFLANAAVDQQCELYIKEPAWKRGFRKIDVIFYITPIKENYQEWHDGLGRQAVRAI